MSMRTRSRDIPRKIIFVLALMATSVLAWGQHEKESKAPAQKESRPSHPSNPGHGSTPSHASAPNHASSPRQENRPSQAPPAANRPQGNAGNRAEGNPGRPGNPPTNRGGSQVGNRGNTSGERSGNATGNRGRNTPGNTPGRGGNTVGSRGGNPGGNPAGNRSGNIAGNRGGMGSRPAPGRTVSLRGGGSASLRPNGQIRSINRNGMQIHNNLRGGRVIVSERNGARIVTTGRGNGYVQRAYVTRGGRSYYSRTYYDHGVYRVGIYRGYNYGGYHYYGYYPGYWYHPGFYGWAYRPWGTPVYWGIGIGGWGWGGSPWYGFYGGYFAPYPVYPSAAFWLTDYVIAANLQAAYASQSAADADATAGYDQAPANYGDGGGGQAANSGPVTLTPEVKEAIAEEVKAQLQQQSSTVQGASPDAQAQAPASDNGEVPPALDPARRTFVVDKQYHRGCPTARECELTGGDVITRLTDTPDADQKVTASVSASKKTDCAAGKQVFVSVDDLQEMHNHFEEQLNNGMKALAEKQGTGGLPKAPDMGTTASDVPLPPPDTNAAKDLTDQQADADQAETQVKQEAAAGPEQQ
jgi:hypothetical protein